MVSEGDLMATFKFEGVDNLLEQYNKLNNNHRSVMGTVIYNGAGVVMKEVDLRLKALIVDNSPYVSNGHYAHGPTSIQKKDLIESLGIAPLRNDHGFYNVKIGFNGYNDVETNRWPNGQPNVLIARSVESGTSWMIKQPFMRSAEQAAKSKCEERMVQTFDEEIKKIIGD